MKQFLFIAGAFCLAMPPSGALAQIAPNDTGAGEARVIQDIGNSGQVGTITFFSSNTGTRVVVKVQGILAGRIEPLAVLRGKSCSSIEPTLGWTLNPLIEGTSTTTIHAPIMKLLSGNYVAVVHADDKVSGHNVACGELTH